MNEVAHYNTRQERRVPWYFAVLLLLTAALHARAGLIFNEVMISATQSGEWIEVFNPDTSALFLSGVCLFEGTDSIPLDPTRKISVPGRGYLLIVQDSIKIRSAYPFIGCRLIEPKSWLTLNNDGDTLGLCNGEGLLLDQVGYDLESWLDQSAPNGISLERRDPQAGSNLASNWALCQNPNGATPGFANSVLPASGKTLRLQAGPKIFRPESGEHLHVFMDLPGAGELKLEVFSFEGRSVHLIRSGAAADKIELAWNGRHDGSFLEPGPYVLLAEWRSGGQKEIRKQSIVVGPGK